MRDGAKQGKSAGECHESGMNTCKTSFKKKKKLQILKIELKIFADSSGTLRTTSPYVIIRRDEAINRYSVLIFRRSHRSSIALNHYTAMRMHSHFHTRRLLSHGGGWTDGVAGRTRRRRRALRSYTYFQFVSVVNRCRWPDNGIRASCSAMRMRTDKPLP